MMQSFIVTVTIPHHYFGEQLMVRVEHKVDAVAIFWSTLVVWINLNAVSFDVLPCKCCIIHQTGQQTNILYFPQDHVSKEQGGRE